MRSSWKLQSRLFTAALAAVGVLGSIGCEGRCTGGGFTASTAGGGAKAAFGFQMEARDTDGDGQVVQLTPPNPGVVLDPGDEFRGTFSFSDRAAGVAFNGTILGGFVIPRGSLTFNACQFPCDKPSSYQIDASGVFGGTYEPVPNTLGPGGYFEVLIVDNGQPGVSDPEDEIWVWVGSGVHAGYNNRIDRWVFRKIEGGNIQIHPLR